MEDRELPARVELTVGPAMEPRVEAGGEPQRRRDAG